MLFDTTPSLFIALLTVLGYLFGSVSSAIIVCRLMRLPDPRSEGSRNPGTTNVLRIGGKKAAIITLAGDMLKGLVPVLIARMLSAEPMVWALVGMAAFIGHLYPVFFRFEGGKGVATGLGAILAWSWLGGLLTIATWLIVAAVFRYSSLAALTAFLLAPIYLAGTTGDMALTSAMSIVTALVYWRHRENIRNLIAGKESKIGKKK
ncbi:glycerol-3-phosphate acyltransferase [Alkalilimnicola ehrlichii]|uniref:glycerol-3-phosphate 1-O-acyltransferase PlsY n=1 Tax=Alkalilimnicola ehrlichii TaxID=351052 RepID=UPI000E2ED1E7|nr:glycerol-3-phosphate 1-O-acyltransferase PlsY [Alkalilimnicola ehrlichii]RFA30137.1 glycerol-3-phosphate acyltransferase [Alkalilimnicola ehrlichii]